jgi:hypothetical protein
MQQPINGRCTGIANSNPAAHLYPDSVTGAANGNPATQLHAFACRHRHSPTAAHRYPDSDGNDPARTNGDLD